MDDRTTGESPHELLLALAGRIDDDLLAWCRELVAVGEDGRALELLTATLIADRTPLPAPVRAAVVAATQLARTGLDTDACLAPAADEDGSAHRFDATSAAVGPLAAAVDALPVRQVAGCRTWVTARVTPAGAAPGPLPHPVVLVEVDAEDTRPVDVLAYQVAIACARAGRAAAVEVVVAGAPRPVYQAAALATARAVHGAAEHAATPSQQAEPQPADPQPAEPHPAREPSASGTPTGPIRTSTPPVDAELGSTSDGRGPAAARAGFEELGGDRTPTVADGSAPGGPAPDGPAPDGPAEAGRDAPAVAAEAEPDRRPIIPAWLPTGGLAVPPAPRPAPRRVAAGDDDAFRTAPTPSATTPHAAAAPHAAATPAAPRPPSRRSATTHPPSAWSESVAPAPVEPSVEPAPVEPAPVDTPSIHPTSTQPAPTEPAPAGTGEDPTAPAAEADTPPSATAPAAEAGTPPSPVTALRGAPRPAPGRPSAVRPLTRPSFPDRSPVPAPQGRRHRPLAPVGETGPERPFPARAADGPALASLTDPLDGPVEPRPAPADAPREPTIDENDPLGLGSLPLPAEDVSEPPAAPAADAWLAEWITGDWAMPPSALDPPAEETGTTPADEAEPAALPGRRRAGAAHRPFGMPTEPDPSPPREAPELPLGAPPEEGRSRPTPRAVPRPTPAPSAPRPAARAAPDSTLEQTGFVLRPESVARLSDADRELLARLQAELDGTPRPRTSHRAGIGDADGPGRNGTADPPDMAG